MSAATELELESELELEGESESELAGELENELGFAQELVHEFELEHEQEAEHEAFFNHLAAMADRSGRSQALRRIALAAARSALRARRKPWPVIQGEMEGELGELESEHELELEASPEQMAQFAAMMEHSGHAAAEAANEQEAAEHFLPLLGLAAKFVLPKIAGFAARKLGSMAARKIGGQLIRRAGSQLLRRVGPRMIRRVTPQLTRGVANVTRTLYRNPTTRPLIHAVPRIARTTVARLGRQVANGRPITPQGALRTLAQQTARTISNPRALAQTYRRSLALDRRYHQRTRRVLGRPTGAPVRANGDFGSAMGGPAMGGPAMAGFPTGPVPGAAGGGWVWQPPSGAAPPMPAMSPEMAPSCPNCGR